MTKIAIVGPGAIGGTVAAWLAQVSGHEITICARTPFDELVVDTPQGTLTARPRVFTDPSSTSPVDWVLVATKAYDSASTAVWLEHLLGSHTRVAVLQNGVEHVTNFAPFAPADRILPVVVDCPAERSAPGRIRQWRAAWMKVPDSPLGRAFQALFATTHFEVRLTPDFLTAAWAKLCVNCAGAVSAITLKSNGSLRHVPEVTDLLRGLVCECVAVGNAEGAQLPESVVETVVASCQNAAVDSINSLHADRLAGRPMEIETRNGVIVRLGAKHGIPTPLNETIVALLKAVRTTS